jgi:hypothetical protein
MKQYQETEHGSFTIEGMTIPNASGNRHYQQMLQEVADGEAEQVPFDHAAKATQDKLDEERAWRDNELTQEVDYYQTRPLLWDELGTDIQAGIAAYRLILLDYPQQPDFPNGSRPVY